MAKYDKKIIKKWWTNLDERIKEEIMDDIFPDDIIYDIDDEWNRLEENEKLEIYRENNP